MDEKNLYKIKGDGNSRFYEAFDRVEGNKKIIALVPTEMEELNRTHERHVGEDSKGQTYSPKVSKAGRIVRNIGYAVLGGLMTFGAMDVYENSKADAQKQKSFENAQLLETNMHSVNTNDLDSILKKEGLSQSDYYRMFDAIREANPGMKAEVNYGNGVPRDGFIAKDELKQLANYGKNIKVPDVNNDGEVYKRKY